MSQVIVNTQDQPSNSTAKPTDQPNQPQPVASVCQLAFQQLQQHINRHIIGQDQLTQGMLIALLADGHILVEGAPGLAKTRAVNVLSQSIAADFQRVQFTPDLLPADLTGTEIYRPQEGTFVFQSGPLFHNIVLADEINRAPAKVQAALLEAMAERQITVAGKTYPLPQLFMVMATQNPIEQEGTYPLPEAQLDRFLLHITIDYPEARHEKSILRLVRSQAQGEQAKDPSKTADNWQPLPIDTVLTARREALDIYMADALEEYLLQIVLATRNPKAYGADLAKWVQYGASPRASIALDRCARARAWLHQRDFVSPDDIQQMALYVLSHRLIMSYEAEAADVTSADFIQQLLSKIPVP